MGNVLFAVWIAAGVVGLSMMCGALVQIKRRGFKQAMAKTAEGMWPMGRLLFVGSMACFGIMNLIWFYSSFDRLEIWR